MAEPEQLKLEMPGTHYSREVSWYIVRPVEIKKRFGRVAIKHESVLDEYGRKCKKTIRADQISELEDENLRYALRFQVAAKALGSFQTSPSCTEGDSVYVDATDEGNSSRFVSATYSGTGKGADSTFIKDLHRAAPNYSEDNSN